MARSGNRGRGTPRRSPRAGGRAPARGAGRSGTGRHTGTDPGPAPDHTSEPRVFRLGAIPGATPGKWIAAWSERMPAVPLELVPLGVADQDAALRDRTVDAALVRLPADDEAFHLIPLYTEIPVAVVPADSHLTAADELDLADLAGEVLIVPADDVLAVDAPGTLPPAFDRPGTTEEAIATVAAGVGVVVVPMSLARLHARRDVATRPVRDAPASTVALAWPRDGDTPDVQTFVGIVRGRTAKSSR